MTVLAFALRSHRLQLVAATVASVASGVASAGLMGYIGSQFVDQGDLDGLVIATFVALIVFSLATGLGARWILIRLVARRTVQLQLELSRRIVATPLPRIEAAGRARLFAMLTDDARAVSDALIRMPDVVISSALVAGSVAYLAWLSPVAVTVLGVAAVPVVVLYRRLHRRVTRLLARFFVVRDERYRQYDGLTAGTKELQADPVLRRRFGRALDTKGEEFRRTHTDVIMAHEVANSWSQAAYFVFILALLVLIRAGWVEGDILGAFALIALYVRGAIVQITAVIPVWTHAGAALDRIDGLGLAPDPEPAGEQVGGALPHGGEAADETNRSEPMADGAAPVEVRADGLAFAYESGDGYSFSLGPIDAELRSGEIVFVTGGNGSGKTTLLKLLCALYEPTEGALRCDGEVVDEANRDAYRSRIAALFADGFLFEELVGLDDPSDEGTDAANRVLAELDLGGKVSVAAGALSTTDLSTGERRRLALLGAFLRDRPIYAFDEWAANQDPVFKRFFYRTVLPELRRRGKLVIVISHDDAYFDAADRVLHLADGRLVEDPVDQDNVVSASTP